MLNFIRTFFAPSTNQQVEQLIREICDRSLAEARRRLNADVAKMSVAELRGYVRARAMRPVRVQTTTVVERSRLQGAMLDEVVSRALERTVHLLVRQLIVQPVVLPTVQQTPLRRAA